jgi:hypothetical protein
MITLNDILLIILVWVPFIFITYIIEIARLYKNGSITEHSIQIAVLCSIFWFIYIPVAIIDFIIIFS